MADSIQTTGKIGIIIRINVTFRFTTAPGAPVTASVNRKEQIVMGHIRRNKGPGIVAEDTIIIAAMLSLFHRSTKNPVMAGGTFGSENP